MFPGPGAQVYRNEEGEPIGWDYPSHDDPYDPDDYLADPWEEAEEDDEDDDEEGEFGRGIPCYCVTECEPDGPCRTENGIACPACHEDDDEG